MLGLAIAGFAGFFLLDEVNKQREAMDEKDEKLDDAKEMIMELESK